MENGQAKVDYPIQYVWTNCTGQTGCRKEEIQDTEVLNQSRDQDDQLSLGQLKFDRLHSDYLYSDNTTRRNKINPNRKILIVDDQPYNIMALKTILQFSVGLKNIEVLSDRAFDGQQAFELVI